MFETLVSLEVTVNDYVFLIFSADKCNELSCKTLMFLIQTVTCSSFGLISKKHTSKYVKHILRNSKSVNKSFCFQFFCDAVRLLCWGIPLLEVLQT